MLYHPSLILLLRPFFLPCLFLPLPPNPAIVFAPISLELTLAHHCITNLTKTSNRYICCFTLYNDSHIDTMASSPTTASTAVQPTASTCANLNDVPVMDASCGIAYSKDNIDIMESCCGGADVVSYFDECGLYCLADEKNVGDLSRCIMDEGIASNAIYCRGQETATATGDGKPRESSNTKPVGGGNSSDDGDDDDGDDNNDSGSGNSDDDGGDDDNAAAGVTPHSGLTLLGVTISTLLFSATALGAFQL